VKALPSRHRTTPLPLEATDSSRNSS
jgi:hypothetical protein